MIRVRVQEIGLFTNLNPTEIAVVKAQLERQLNDHLEPKHIRARKRWRETVVIEAGSGVFRYFCNCRIKDEPSEEYTVRVTGITKTQGNRSGAKPTR